MIKQAASSVTMTSQNQGPNIYQYLLPSCRVSEEDIMDTWVIDEHTQGNTFLQAASSEFCSDFETSEPNSMEEAAEKMKQIAKSPSIEPLVTQYFTTNCKHKQPMDDFDQWAPVVAAHTGRPQFFYDLTVNRGHTKFVGLNHSASVLYCSESAGLVTPFFVENKDGVRQNPTCYFKKDVGVQVGVFKKSSSQPSPLPYHSYHCSHQVFEPSDYQGWKATLANLIPDDVAEQVKNVIRTKFAFATFACGLELSSSVCRSYWENLSQLGTNLCNKDPSQRNSRLLPLSFYSKFIDEVNDTHDAVAENCDNDSTNCSHLGELLGEDPFRLDKLVIALHEGSMLSSIVVGFMQKGTIEVFGDSRVGEASKILRFLRKEHKALKGHALPGEWKIIDNQRKLTPTSSQPSKYI
jgi:hypothetical protein